MYVDNGSAFTDSWLLRACAKLGIRLVHSTPHRPQGRGKIERLFRTVRDQFCVEITDTTAEELAAAGVDHRAALLELNRLFTAWVETEYHRRTHTETGQSPWERWEAGWSRLGRTAAMPTSDDLTEAFLWSEYRTVTKTATVSLHGNTFEVDAALIGRRVELVFSPFDLETIDVRYREASYGRAVAHIITRHTHPKARPETPEPPPAATGIDYLALTAATHHEQIRADGRIGYNALFTTTPPPPVAAAAVAVAVVTVRSPGSCPSTTSTTPTATTTRTARTASPVSISRTGCRREYRTAATVLRVHPDALRAWSGPGHAAPPPRPQRSRGPDLLVCRSARHRGHHR